VNPDASAVADGSVDIAETHLDIVVTSNGDHRAQAGQLVNEFAQLGELGSRINQIPAQQNRVRNAFPNGSQYLSRQQS